MRMLLLTDGVCVYLLCRDAGCRALSVLSSMFFDV
jgi:hypothetical protein